jgi:peptide/nickel transport system substrate-binding protein
MATLAAHIPTVNPSYLLAHSTSLQNLVISALNEPRLNEAWLCGEDSDDSAAPTTTVALASGLLGIDPGPAACAAAAGGSVVVALAEELPTLDATNDGTLGTSSNALYALIYDRFFRTTPDLGELDPQLATSAEANEDYTEWTIHLREGVTFHDGSPFTAADAAFSLLYTFDQWNGYTFGPMADVSIVDDFTVSVTFDSPYSSFLLEGLAAPFSGIVFKEDFGGLSSEEYFQAPITTGPYSVEDYNPSMGLTLVANNDYWGDGPYLETVEVRFVSDPVQRSLGLQAGEFAYADMMTARLMDELPAGVQGRVLPSTAVVTLFIWPHNPLLADDNVRAAIRHAIDREKIAEFVYGDYATAAGTYLPSNLPGVNGIDGDEYDFDLERARALMADSEFPDGGSFELVYTSGNPNIELEAQLIQANLSEIDIDVALAPVSASEYAESMDGRTAEAALFNNTAITADPVDFTSFIVLDFGVALGGSWPIEVLEDVVERLFATDDPAEAEALYDESAAYMATLAAHIPTVNPSYLLAHSTSLQNLVISALNEPRLNEAWLCEG